MTPMLAAIVAAGIVLPHVLQLRRVAPVTAIALWLSSLALRALACALVVVYILSHLPRTSLFDAATHWCWHAVIPVLAGEHALEGHRIGDVALLIPGLLVAMSLLWVSVGLARAARAARHLLERDVLGEGPRGSVIVGGPEVVLAVAGVARPRIVVSAGALTRLDDEELAAALDHEQAHIAHRHRFVILLAVALRAAGRLIPGGARAVRELGFHLERDADRWALGRLHDRSALARVIRKAASAGRPAGSLALARLGEAEVRERLSQLLELETRGSRRVAAVALDGLAAVTVALTLLLAAILPASAVAGVARDAHQTHHAHCEH